MKPAVVQAEQCPLPATNARDGTAPPSDTAMPSEPIGHNAPPYDHLPPQVGSTVKRYELLRKLGEGAMGKVYLARDTKLARLVAIKVLRLHTGSSAERFLIEAQATARCRHDNIVVIHEVDDIRGYPYMVLEYLEGQTLREWMAQRARTAVGDSLTEANTSSGLVSPSLAIELMLPVLRALACAHKLGIVHRDLKPENIFLTTEGRVVVLDFGIAKRLDASELSAIQFAAPPLHQGAVLTQEGALLGTLPYMSPEQLLSRGIDARSDLWTVGIILYELVTGVRPLSHRSVSELLEIAASEEPVPRVRDKRSDAGELGAIIDRCLHKQRDHRYGSAEQLLAALEALGADRQARELGAEASPFAGLVAFQEADAERFVGREREILSLTGRLRNQPLLIVAGPSGAGKSSCVRAGVIPALKRSGERWEALILRPGLRPLAALADLLAQIAPASRDNVPARTFEAGCPDASCPDTSSPDALLGALHTQPGLVGVRLRARCRREGGGHRILLFVDQFEELYTLGAGAAERAAFVACLEGAADDASSPLRVIFSIRSDFLDRMAEERHFSAEVTRGLVFLGPMGRDGLREALSRPLETAGYRFENEDMIQALLGGLEHAKSPLPLLQFTAAKLWEARDRTTRLLTQISYDQLGGVAGALSAHANAVLSALSSADQRLCRAVLLRLCTPERTRAVVRLSDLRALAGDSGAVEQVIHRLSDARLVLVETGGEHDGTTVELCHESLIDRWDKFQQWLSESEQDAQFVARLYAAARQWETGQEADGLLWRDRAAREASDWLARQRAEQTAGESIGLGTREERFLLAVVALSERARRLRKRIVAGVLAAVSVIATVVLILSVSLKREATAAQVEARQARNATRMTAARELEPRDPTTMLALLREVEPPGVPRGWAELVSKALQSGRSYDVRGWGAIVGGVAWSPDGQRIVAALYDGTARVWKSGEMAEPIVLRGHENIVYSAVFSPDGTHIVTASSDKTARVWNADGSGQPVVLRGHDSVVYSAVFSPDGTHIITASEDKTARVWNADGSGKPIILRGHEDQVYSAVVSRDGTHIVTVSSDKTARVWNTDGSGQPVVLRGHEGTIYSAAFSSDDRRILTASDDKTVRVWNTDGSGKPIVLHGHEGPVRTVASSPDGKRIVTGSDDKTARVWNADGSGVAIVLRGHEATVPSAAFSPDGNCILTASEDNTVRVWNADGSGDPLVLRGHEGAIHAAWSPDGASIATGSYDYTTRVFRIDLLRTSAPTLLRGHESIVSDVAFSPDNQHIVSASSDKTARVWRTDGSGPPVVLRGHEGRIFMAAFSPDNQRIVTASSDLTARVWRADGSGQPVVLRGHQGAVSMATFSPDNQHIVTASDDKTARVWNADGSGQPLVLRGHESKIWLAAFSPDGKRVATGSDDHTMRIWNADGSGEVQIYSVYGGIPYHGVVDVIAWSPDGKRIVSLDGNNAARVWNIDHPWAPVILRGHAQAVNSAAWSPDGNRIVTASADATARIWNADGSGQPVVLRGHKQELTYAAFSPDGQHIITTSTDGTARIWNIDGYGEPYVLHHGQAVLSAAWSPDGTRVVTHVYGGPIVWVWPVQSPLRGIDDPRLWAATPYCLSIERRIALLSVSEVRARADQEACARRVQAAVTTPSLEHK
jgi:WD40 repeat protein/predicted Ser/Thr protein kinase